MRFRRRPFFIIILIFGFFISAGCAHNSNLRERSIASTVCFTPGDDCAGLIVGEIEKSKRQILVQAYSFTSAPIAEALVNAFKRGVKVDVILDKSQKTGKYSSADFLSHARIPTYIDDQHAIAHNKVMVIDGTTVITGSFNFTKAAQEKNAENLLILHDSWLASKYVMNWNQHQEHSAIY